MFKFIRYINPGWYFNLTGENSRRYWADYSHLHENEKLLLDFPDCYKTNDALYGDLAYQAWIKGLIVDNSQGLDIKKINPSVKDEYCFVKRFYNPLWTLFILFSRIIELHNPFKEIYAFCLSLPVKRINPHKKIKKWDYNLKSFNYKTSTEKPLVSIVIPTLNRYQYLKDVLSDLEKQDYKHFEVLIVDQSEPFQADFYNDFNLDIKVWFQEEKALWLARNDAIKKSAGDFILLFDDDSRVEANWIRSHLYCMEFFKADISSGVSISVVGAKIPETYSYYKWSDQVDTGNVMIKKNVFRKIGLFDRQFEKQRQGDGEFGLRAYLAGYKNISNPEALRLHLKVSEGGLRQMGSWDGWRPKKFLAPRPVPSVLYLTRKYFGNRAAVYQILISVLPSLIPYRYKRNNLLIVLGSFFGLFLLPLVFVSVMRSWNQASNKLKEGAKISALE